MTLTNDGRSLVLMYHDVRICRNLWEQRYCVTPSRFQSHLQALRDAGYRPCSLSDFSAWIAGRGKLQPDSILITFDDGYAGVYEHAYPLLQERSIPFAVFVVTSAVGEHDSWMRESNPDGASYPLLSRPQLQEFTRAGVGVGSHSRRHLDLASLADAALRDEVYGSRAELEDMLGQKVDGFAYPFGRLNDAVRTCVAEAGYACAFSTRSGFNRPGDDPLLVRRIDVYGTDTVSTLLRKLRFGTNDGSLVTAGRYYTRRLLTRCGLASTA